MAINKNISIWKGDKNPPTKYHLWVKDNGDICAYLDGKWGKVASVDQADKIQLVTTGPTDEYEETYQLQFDGAPLGDIIKIPKAKIDSIVSDTSTNAVANKTIKQYVDKNKVTSTSELVNDSGFLTEHQSLKNYATNNYVDSITSIVIVDKLCGQGIYTFDSAVSAILAKESKTGIKYIQHGSIITYTIADGTMESKQYIGNGDTISTDGGYWITYNSGKIESKFYLETALDGFYVIDNKKNIGLQYNKDGLDAALVAEHLKKLIVSDNVEEAPNDNNAYIRRNKSWINIKENNLTGLWLGKFDQGTINSTSGNNDNTISTSVDQAVSQDVIATPYIGCTFTIQAPAKYKIQIYYNPTLNRWPYTLANTSEWLSNGDTFTMPNAPQGGDGQATAIQFKLAIKYNGTFDLNTIQNLVDSGDIALLYEGSDVILDHVHQESQAKNVGAYSTVPQLENIGNIPYFGYLTDIHSDVTRYERFLKYCDYLKVDAAILGGDYTISNATDGFNYLHTIASNYSTKVLPVVGNHDAWQYSTATMYNKFLKDFGYGSTYYYQDIHNIRIIVLNLYETTSTSFKNKAISQTQMDWLISTLKATPSTYGILLCYHEPNGTLTEDSNYNTFFTESPNNNDPLKTSVGIDHIIKVIDAYMSKSSTSGSYTADGGTVSYTADFTSLTSTGEFIAHITGHYHRDLVGYYNGTTNKQLVISTICGNGYSPQHCFSFIRDGRGSSQDGMTFFGINRTTGKVMIARVGADIDVDGRKHDIMYIPYK